MNQPGQDVSINLTDCENIKCEGKVVTRTDTGPSESICGCLIWQKAAIIKRIPGVMLGQPADQEYPIDVMVCAACGAVRLPPAMRPPAKEESPIIGA